MAVTTENSDEVDLTAANTLLPVSTHGGTVKCSTFSFTQGAAAGDAGSKAILSRLPGGKLRVLALDVAFSAMGTSRTLDFGHNGKLELDDTVTAADPDHFSNGLDVSSAGSARLLINKEVVSKRGFYPTLQVNDGTLPIAATLSGIIWYVVD